MCAICGLCSFLFLLKRPFFLSMRCFAHSMAFRSIFLSISKLRVFPWLRGLLRYSHIGLILYRPADICSFPTHLQFPWVAICFVCCLSSRRGHTFLHGLLFPFGRANVARYLRYPMFTSRNLDFLMAEGFVIYPFRIFAYIVPSCVFPLCIFCFFCSPLASCYINYRLSGIYDFVLV